MNFNAYCTVIQLQGPQPFKTRSANSLSICKENWPPRPWPLVILSVCQQAVNRKACSEPEVIRNICNTRNKLATEYFCIYFSKIPLVHWQISILNFKECPHDRTYITQQILTSSLFAISPGFIRSFLFKTSKVGSVHLRSPTPSSNTSSI